MSRRELTEEQKEAARERSRKHYAANREKKLAYQRNYNKEYRQGIRRKRKDNDANGLSIIGWITIKYSGIPCMDCGGVFDWCAMDFDHRPDEEKEFAISRMSRYLATSERLSLIEKEIAKCDLVCSNCHRVRTKKRNV